MKENDKYSTNNGRAPPVRLPGPTNYPVETAATKGNNNNDNNKNVYVKKWYFSDTITTE